MQSHGCVFALEVSEDLLDHRRIFDAGDDLDVTAAVLAGLDVDVTYRDVDVTYRDNGMDPLHLQSGLAMGQNGVV